MHRLSQPWLKFGLTLLCLVASQALAQDPAPTPEVRYTGGGKRDPFRPMTISAPTLQTLSQLQSFNLNELSLVGTLLGNDMSALLMTPKKEGIIARVGDKVGNQGGRIVLIGNTHIVVREPAPDAQNGTSAGGSRRPRFNDVTLPLAQKKGDLSLPSTMQQSDAAQRSEFGLGSESRTLGTNTSPMTLESPPSQPSQPSINPNFGNP